MDAQVLLGRIEALEQEVRALRAMKQGPRGEAGRDGKDGRDGRDGKSINPARLFSMIRSAFSEMPRQSIHVEAAPQAIVVQPSEVVLEARLPDMPVAPPTPIENHVHVPNSTEFVDAIERLHETMRRPMRPIYDDEGRLVGGERA